MDADRSFAGSIPALYDRLLGPMIFAPYAADLAARLAGLRAGSVLETAAGTGIVTRALVAALPESVAIVATDLNQAMLDHASARLASPRLSWRQADAGALPFPNAAFDAVLCQFGVMFFPDRARALAETRRVLKPAGRFLFNVWDRIEENDFADQVTRALAARYPEQPPRFMARTPHGHHDVAMLADQLRAASFADITVETLALESRAPDAGTVAAGFCQGTPLRAEIEALEPGGLPAATQAVAAVLAARFGPGPVRGRMQAHVLTATG